MFLKMVELQGGYFLLSELDILFVGLMSHSCVIALEIDHNYLSQVDVAIFTFALLGNGRKIWPGSRLQF